MKSKPWRHQEGAVEYACARRAALLHCWMGTGKTLMSYLIIERMGHKKTLVVCPAKVIHVWCREAEKHGFRGKVVPLDAKARKKMDAKGDVYVTNYEAFARDSEFLKQALRMEWDCIFLDESHRAKAPTGRISKTLAKLKAKHRICLTGTPMPHSPLDIFAQYRFLDQSIFGKYWTRFKANYAILGGPRQQWIQGTRNLDELGRLTDLIRHCVTADALDLPEISVIDRAFSLSSEAKPYASMERDFIADVGSGVVTASNALVRLLRLQQMVNGFVQVEEGGVEEIGTSKLDDLMDLLEDVEPSEPVVVFARFTHDIDRITKACEGAGRRCARLSGHWNELAEWERGEKSVIVVQIQSGSEGIDLTKARYGVFYSLPFSLGQYDQAIARLHRPGQKRSTIIYRLIAESSVDSKVAKALAARREVIDSLLSAFLGGGD